MRFHATRRGREVERAPGQLWHKSGGYDSWKYEPSKDVYLSKSGGISFAKTLSDVEDSAIAKDHHIDEFMSFQLVCSH